MQCGGEERAPHKNVAQRTPACRAPRAPMTILSTASAARAPARGGASRPLARRCVASCAAAAALLLAAAGPAAGAGVYTHCKQLNGCDFMLRWKVNAGNNNIDLVRTTRSVVRQHTMLNAFRR